MILRKGDYVKQTSQPQSGIGKVISISDGEKVTVFFLRGGKRIFWGSSPDLEQVNFYHAILELAGSVNWNYADRNLYVVELNPKIFDWERRFFEANLHWIPGKQCVYVGVTGLTPEARIDHYPRQLHPRVLWRARQILVHEPALNPAKQYLDFYLFLRPL